MRVSRWIVTKSVGQGWGTAQEEEMLRVYLDNGGQFDLSLTDDGRLRLRESAGYRMDVEPLANNCIILDIK